MMIIGSSGKTSLNTLNLHTAVRSLVAIFSLFSEDFLDFIINDHNIFFNL